MRRLLALLGAVVILRGFAIACAIALFWSLVAVRLGVWKLVANAPEGDAYRRLLTTFAAWETLPLSRHGFLAFLSPDDVAAGSPYANYSYGYLFLSYAIIRGLGLVFGISGARAQALMPLVYAGLLLVVCLFAARRAGAARRSPSVTTVVLLFLGLGIVMTTPPIWLAVALFPPDNYHPYAALAFAALAASHVPRQPLDGVARGLLVALALVAPLYTFVAVGVLFLLDAPLNRPTIAWRRDHVTLALVAVIGGVSLALPRLVAWAVAGARIRGSSYAYRSGLDGSSRYFDSLAQAVLNPVDAAGRAWHVLHLPIVVIAAVIALWLAGRDRAWVGRTLRRWLIALTPFVFLVVWLPQFTSIHPYAADVHLALACTFTLFLLALDEELTDALDGAGLVVACFIGSALIMTSLLDIARAARAAGG